MRMQHVFVSHVTKQHVNKKKAIKSKSRPSIYVSLNSNNLIFLPNLNSKKLNSFLMFDWVKTWIFYENRKNFYICIKLAELWTKIKNSPQPQVRNLSCQSPQVRMSATFFVSPQLRICGLADLPSSGKNDAFTHSATLPSVFFFSIFLWRPIPSPNLFSIILNNRQKSAKIQRFEFTTNTDLKHTKKLCYFCKSNEKVFNYNILKCSLIL